MVQLWIAPKSNDFMNFRIPSCSFKATVGPQSSCTILSLMKIVPQNGWGEYEPQCNYQVLDIPS